LIPSLQTSIPFKILNSFLKKKFCDFFFLTTKNLTKISSEFLSFFLVKIVFSQKLLPFYFLKKILKIFLEIFTFFSSCLSNFNILGLSRLNY